MRLENRSVDLNNSQFSLARFPNQQVGLAAVKPEIQAAGRI
jgi:hypothetical protein